MISLVNSWLGLLLFLLLVAPGLFYELRTEARRPAVEESAFREISRVALSSLVFSVAAFSFLSLLGRAAPTWLVDLQSYANDPRSYLGKHLWLALRSMLYQFILSMLGVLIVDFCLQKKNGPGSILPVSVWYRVFKDDPKRFGVIPYVTVTLNGSNEQQFFGKLQYYTSDFKGDSREIALGRPLFEGAGTSLTPLPGNYDTVIINDSQILSMLVEYRRRPTSV